jgi:hypothetical protein
VLPDLEARNAMIISCHPPWLGRKRDELSAIGLILIVRQDHLVEQIGAKF